ncbi:unnamed protein product [Ectocarpus sp. 12 AP-2014]
MYTCPVVGRRTDCSMESVATRGTYSFLSVFLKQSGIRHTFHAYHWGPGKPGRTRVDVRYQRPKEIAVTYTLTIERPFWSRLSWLRFRIIPAGGWRTKETVVRWMGRPSGSSSHRRQQRRYSWTVANVHSWPGVVGRGRSNLPLIRPPAKKPRHSIYRFFWTEAQAGETFRNRSRG